jgi:hypothetical protein
MYASRIGARGGVVLRLDQSLKANADIDSLASRFLVETHLSRLFEEPSIPEESETEPSAGTDLDALPTTV